MKKWFVYLSLSLLFLSFTYAAVNTGNLKAYYYFADNADDVLGNHNGTDIDSPTYDNTILAGNLNESVYLDGTNDAISLPTDTFTVNASAQFYIAMWVNFTPDDNADCIVRFDSTGTGYIQIRDRSDLGGDIIRFQYKDDSNILAEVDIAVTRGTPIFLEFFKNGTKQSDTYVFEDLALLVQEAGATAQGAATFDDYMRIGMDNADDWQSMYISDFMIFSKTPSLTERQEIYNSGSGFPYPFVNASSPPPASANYSLLINHNMLDTSNITAENLTITFNGTVTDSHGIFNCTIIEGSTNYTKYDVDLSNLQTFIYNFSEVEQMFNFTIDCVNNNTQNITDMYFYEVDRVNPRLSINFTNNTLFWKDDSYGFEFNCSDTNLYAHAINSTVKDDFLDNLGGTTNVYLLNLTNSAEGNFTIVQECWDSHTKTSISDYNITYSSHELVFDGVTISSPNATKIDYEKKEDRYEFYIETTDVIYVECEGLRIIEDSKYKGHLVCWKEKKWVDFENYEVQDVIVKRISDNEVSILTDAKTFKSVGDLNYVQEGYVYEVVEELPYRLSLINTRVIELEEEKKMIWVVMLWIIGTAGAFVLLQGKNAHIGTLYWFLGGGLDLLLLNQIYSIIGTPGTADILGFGIGIFYVAAILFILFRVFIPVIIKRKAYVKY